MITDSKQLADIAKEAGIKVPENLNDFDLNEHLHFVIFMTTQRGEAMPYPTAALENAKLIGSLDEETIKIVSIEDLIDLGFKFGAPTIATI